MTRDDIIRMAREAGIIHPEMVDKTLERFAALVAAAERERVMQVVQSMKADLEARFEKSYMEGVVAGAAAERERLAHPEQEPEPVCDKDPQGCWNVRCQLGKVCKNTPPRREWVGLEPHDMPDGEDPIYDDPRFIAGVVWAAKKLMEKNG